jgi:hypothetical protein
MSAAEHHDPVCGRQRGNLRAWGALDPAMEARRMRYLFPILLALTLAGAPVAAQQPGGQGERAPAVGHGLICDSPQQLHRFVDMRNQGREEEEAVQAINEEAKNPVACGSVMAAFAPGKPVDKVKMLGETVEFIEITVIAISDGKGWTKVPPTTQYAIRTEPGIGI